MKWNEMNWNEMKGKERKGKERKGNKIKVYGEQAKWNLGLLNTRINFKKRENEKNENIWYLPWEVIMSYSVWLSQATKLVNALTPTMDV